jgi:phosphate butyryltransferase
MSFSSIRNEARDFAFGRVAVACPHDEESLGAILDAAQESLAEPVLVGNPELIRQAARRYAFSLENCTIVEAFEEDDAARQAVRQVRIGAADVVMKGALDTATLLRAVLDPEHGLRTGRVLSHVALFTPEGYDRFILVTDAAMNIAPTLEQKREIVLNALEVAHAIGLKTPRVAVLCAKEKVDSKMPATTDAAALKDTWQDGALPGCILGGPFALDNAIDPHAARIKGIDDPVAGRADILLAPDIEAANILYKSLVFFARAPNAGIILGATAPIVLTSRADSRQSRVDSIALAALHARYRQDAALERKRMRSPGRR